MKNNVAIFAGTTEGRNLVEKVAEKTLKIKVFVCVTTEYGKDLLLENDDIKVHVGPLDEHAMADFFDANDIGSCFDATHPYATKVTKSLIEICDEKDISYYRVERESEISKICEEDGLCAEDIVLVDSVDEAVDYLEATEGNIFISTGSKELAAFTRISDYKNRCVARVLSTESVASQCKELGFEGKNLICMQGPFSELLNYAMLLQTDAKYFVTKESGKAGGFIEKFQAAKKANATLVVIKRPELQDEQKKNVIDIKQAVDIISKMIIEKQSLSQYSNQFSKQSSNQFFLVSMGPGNTKFLTKEAEAALNQADCIIGASRLIDCARDFLNEKNPIFVKEYKTEAIFEYVEAHKEINSFAFVFSGDIGFYSGAKKLTKALQEKGCEITLIPGISSPIYLCDKTGISWQNMKFASLHGMDVSIENELMQYENIAFLIGNKEDGSRIAKELCKLNKASKKMIIGQRLSYEDEEIIIDEAKNLCDISIDPLSVVIVGGFDE